MKSMKLVPAAALAGLFLSAPDAQARFAVRPKMVPIARLSENVEAVLKKNPKDAQAHYVLGRLHSMAFAGRTDTVEISEPFRKPPKPNPLPGFAPYRSILVKPPAKPPTLKLGHLLNLEASLRHYQMAIKLDPKNTKARLGLAWMYETGQKVAVAVKNAPAQAKALPKTQQDRLKALAGGVDQWEANAMNYYREVLKKAGPSDLKKGFAGPGADSIISQDASRAIQRILGQPGRKQTAAEKKELADVAAHLKNLGKLGRIVTPIIFPLDKPRPLKSLLSTGATTFDLDGDGLKSEWPWLKPNTGLLVWDPKRTGKIKDGRQLFGNVTWWIFWNHGYEPMALLDDNRNGWLEGKELSSLSVWQDRNHNGVSDKGEVKPVTQLGIKRLACQPLKNMQHPAGLEMSDGRRLPTYDWTPKSIPARD
jgi:hypothetical protein